MAEKLLFVLNTDRMLFVGIDSHLTVRLYEGEVGIEAIEVVSYEILSCNDFSAGEMLHGIGYFPKS